MRLISSTLLKAQQAKSVSPLIKITLSLVGQTDIILTKDKILDINHIEEPYSHRCELTLENADAYFTNKDLKGWRASINYGCVTSAGEEYSACAPLWVMSQRLDSSPGRLVCVLNLIGIPNLLADDEANASYIPTKDDTKAVKTLINEILGATLACYSHCTAYEVVYDSEDSLIGTYQPKDGFRIYIGGSRLAAIRRLLDYTKCVMRFGADGKIHILLPQTSGTPVYEYSLTTGHTFFSKASRKRLVIPNRIIVKSQPEDSPQYQGEAVDSESYALLPKTAYYQGRLTSNAQATEIATAILSKHQLWSELGSASVPMNVGAEVFDYVKVTDERQGDSRTGNIGYLARYWNAQKAEWRMVFSFGNYDIFRTRETLKEDEQRYNYTNLKVKNLFAENIDFVWLDPDNTIDLSKIGDNLDNLPDGTTYARVKTLHLDAGQIKLDEHILYASGYNPTTKEREIKKQATAPPSPAIGDLWLDTSVSPNLLKRWTGAEWALADPDNLDKLPDGSTYKRLLSTQISAGKIYLSDQCEYASGYNPITKEREIKKQTTAPTSPAVGDLWLDTSVTPNLLKRWTGTAWVKADPANVDDLPDGTVYRRTKSAALTADGLVLLDQTITGTYGLVLATAISAGYIKLSTTIKDGNWYDQSGVSIDATTGIEIYGIDMALKTAAYKGGPVRVYVGSDGRLIIRDGFLDYRDSAGGLHWGRWYFNVAKGGLIYTSSLALIDIGRDGVVSFGMSPGAEFGISPYFTEQKRLTFRANYDHMYSPNISNYGYLGDPTYYWWRVYANTYFGKVTTIQSFQDHDDIALIKKLRAKKVKDKDGTVKDVIDFDSLPEEVKVVSINKRTKEKEEFVNMGSLSSLALGAIGQLADRVKALEVKVGL